MASAYVTRAERAGNIFFRVSGLIRSGQMQWADRPLWYDVYVAHPPLTTPDWNVKLPKNEESVRKIFYEEDTIRAQFYKKYRAVGHIDVRKEGDSISQKFINEYRAVMKEESSSISEEEAFTRTEKRLEDLGVPLRNQPKAPPTVQKETA